MFRKKSFQFIIIYYTTNTKLSTVQLQTVWQYEKKITVKCNTCCKQHIAIHHNYIILFKFKKVQWEFDHPMQWQFP